MAESNATVPHTSASYTMARHQIEHAFESAEGLLKASLRALPTQTGDGSYIAAPEVTGLIKDLRKMGLGDAETLLELVTSTVSGKPTDDKTYFMERLIKLASELPLTSENGVKLTSSLVGKLWSDLHHPPSSFLGDHHVYREADGSNNVGIEQRVVRNTC